jgi:transcription antitermination factor NusG
MLRWYVVQSRVGMEETAKRSIKAAGFEEFLPTFMRIVRHGRKTEEVVRPLFRPYLFVKLDVDQDWGTVLRCYGVYTLLGLMKQPGLPSNYMPLQSRQGRPATGDRVSKGDPVPVPIGIVEALQQATEEGGGHVQLLDETKELPRLKKGQRVIVTEGPFMSFEGLVQKDQKARVRILLDFMGKQTPIVAHRESLAVKS